MSLACKCDRCRKFYERTSDFNDRKYRICGQRNNLEMDICNDCYKKFVEWIEGVRNCPECKHSKNGKIQCSETCHLCMWENQFEKAEKVEVCCSNCKYAGTAHDEEPCINCNHYSLWEYFD